MHVRSEAAPVASVLSAMYPDVVSEEVAVASGGRAPPGLATPWSLLVQYNRRSDESVVYLPLQKAVVSSAAVFPPDAVAA